MKKISFGIVLILCLGMLACTPKPKDVSNNSSTVNPVNSEAKKSTNGIYKIADYIASMDYGQYKVATFAGGCFWCTEASFERINGVVDVISGYSGGEKPYPTYKEVSYKQTKHAEAIQIYYDPAVIDYATLLKVFFVAHDPTTLNRQGPDVGPQYRSAIFYHNEEEKRQSEKYIKELNESGKFRNPIVTELTPYEEFWVAEAYHQDYYEHNPASGYIQTVSRPKVEKVKKEFASILKKEYMK